MKFKPMCCKTRAVNRARAGFTLVEALAALMFMALVIPVAVKGLQIASLTGQVAAHKSAAVRIAERIIQETILTSQGQIQNQTGVVEEGSYVYRWQIRTEPWLVDAIKVMTVQVAFTAQGQEYDVHLSTMLDTSQQ